MVSKRSQRGFSLIELLIVAAIVSLFFGGFFVVIQQSLKLVSDTRGRLTALTVANDYMEYIRSLSYNSVGTVSGLPSGLLPQYSSTTVNGQVFTRRVLVEYIDSPADGVGGADTNAITTDYKQAKVEVSWVEKGEAKKVYLISNIVPRSIETNVGGGTIRVYVFDANVAPLPGASVRLLNTSGTTTVDVTKSTDASGIALFGGAPAGANYQIFATAPGYSTDRTYLATTSLPNPTTLPIAVAAAGISSMSFFIDRLGGLSLRTLSSQIYTDYDFTFASSSDVATSTNTTVISDELRLTSTSGVYAPTGTAYLRELAPSPIVSWDAVTITATTTTGTAYRLRVYNGTTTPALIPDAVLPGNSAGFTTGSIDLRTVPAATYPALVFGLTLTTSNTAVSPRIGEVAITYLETETPQSGVALTARGAKVIGTTASGTTVYKTTRTGTSNASGYMNVADLEWDTYTITATGYDIAEACPGAPVSVSPGATSTVDLILAANSAYSARITVKNSSGVAIPGATVSLFRTSTTTKTASHCGQAFFGGLTSANDYQLTVSAPGYTTTVINPFNVTAGDILQTVTLP